MNDEPSQPDMASKHRMLTELTTAMRRHHARRRWGRRLGTASAMLAVAAGAVWVTTSRPATRNDFDHGVRPGHRATTVQIVRHAPRTGLIKTIDDTELLVRLAEIDRPTGMIRTEGRVWLTDPVIGPARDDDGGDPTL